MTKQLGIFENAGCLHTGKGRFERFSGQLDCLKLKKQRYILYIYERGRAFYNTRVMKLTPVFRYKHLILHENLFLSIMQQLDERITDAGELIRAGEITTFAELFKFVPKTVIAKAMSTNTSKWYSNKFEDPYFFRVGEMIELAGLMKIEAAALLAIMVPSIAAIKDRKLTAKPKAKNEDVASERKRAKELKARKMKNKEIMELMDISRMTLYRYLKESDDNGG